MSSMGKELEVRLITDPKAFVEELGALARARNDPETKYQFQIKLQDVEFSVDEGKAQELGFSLPGKSVDEAEQALRKGVLNPTRLVEQWDETAHQVIEFDPTPVAFSGFANRVTHSLAMTDRGLFEIGRYPAVDLARQTWTWQWFIHRRVLAAEGVEELQKVGMSSQEILDLFCRTVYMGLAGRSR